MSNNIGNNFAVVLIIALFFSMIALTANEVLTKNTNLDTDSQKIISDIVYEVDTNFNTDSFALQEDELTENSSFEGTDAFQREFLESKSQASQDRSLFGKITGVPDLILAAIGIQNSTIVVLIKTLLLSWFTFELGLAVYKAWKTGEVDG